MAAVATTTAVAADYAALVQQIYIAYFGRPADPIGFTNYKAQLAALNAPTTLKGLLESNDTSIKALVNSFGTSAESVALYGTDTIAFVKAIFVNVLNREAGFNGLVFWAGEIDAGRLSKAAAALNIAQGALENGTEQGLMDKATLENKIAAASAFTTEIDTTEELSAYSGATAASMARDMLKTVTSTTVAADFQATVVSTLAAVVVANAPVVVPPSSMTVTLTSGADASTSLAGDDTFVGTESTLSSADILNGGAGTDTLRVANSGAAKTFSGFELSNIEIVQVTADGTGATAFDITGTTGITKIANHGSSQDLTFTGLKAIPTTGLALSGVTGGNTTVTFEADAIAGSTDTLKVELNGAKTIANGVIGTITANGIETIAVTTTGASSNLAAIASTSLKAMTVTGDKSLTLAGVTFTDNVNVNTLNAGGLTGTAALNVTVTANTATLDVAVTGGAGDDRADFSTGFDAKDAFTGGAGRDTLALTQAVAAAPGGSVTTVEVLEITNGGTGTISMANFAGVDTVYYSGLTGGTALTGTATISNAVTGITVRDAVDAVAQSVTVTLATNGSADVANFNFDGVAAADNIGTLSAAQFETVNITTADDATALGTGALTIAGLTNTVATKLVIAGNAALTIAGSNDPATAVLATIDASTATAAVTISGTDLAAGGATVTLGSANDTFNVATAAGADTFDLSKGGVDTIVYNAVAQSSANTDTVIGFTSGSDKIDLTALGLTAAAQFKGVKGSFGEAQGALTASALSAVFDSSTGILWVDTQVDGTLDSRDFRIKLSGVSTVVAADFFTAPVGVTFTANKAAFNTATAADSTEANAVAANDDSIVATIAQLAGSTINGLGGNDTLTLTTAGAVGAMAATNVETLVLASASTTANTGVSLAAATNFKHITGSSNADTVSITNLVAGGAVSLGNGIDNITDATEALIEGTDSTFVGGTSSNGSVVDVDVLTFAAAITTATLDLSRVSGFETIDLGAVAAGGLTTTAAKFAAGVTTLKGDTTTGNITVNMTGAQLDALTTINSVATGNTFAIVVNDTAAVTVDLSDTTFTTAFVDNISFAASSAATVTINGELGTAAAAQALTLGTGVDTLNINGVVASAGGRLYNLGGGADIVNVNVADGIVTATDLDTTASTTAILNVKANVTTAALTLATNMDIFKTVNFTVDQVSGGNAVTINNGATTVTAVGGDFILGTGGDTFSSSGTAANIVTGGTGNDTITFANTLGNTLNTIVFGTASGLDTITFNSTNGVADTIGLNDGAGTVGLALATDRFTVNGFNATHDIIRLDTVQTTAATAAAATPVVQAVSAAGALLLSSGTADVTVLNFDMGGSTAVLAGVTNGAALLANLGGTLTAAAGNADDGYIIAYDNGNAYLYAYTNATSAGVLAAEIALIGTINGLATGALGVANFSLAA